MWTSYKPSGEDKPLEAAVEYDPLSGIYLRSPSFTAEPSHFINKNKPEIQKYLSSIFHFSVHHAAVDLAVVWQNVFNSNAVVGTSNGLLASLAGICAEMVVSGAVSEFRCLRTPLCAVRLYPDRRYFPEYGCEP